MASDAVKERTHEILTLFGYLASGLAGLATVASIDKGDPDDPDRGAEDRKMTALALLVAIPVTAVLCLSVAAISKRTNPKNKRIQAPSYN